jgi:hypothetical protein
MPSKKPAAPTDPKPGDPKPKSKAKLMAKTAVPPRPKPRTSARPGDAAPKPGVNRGRQAQVPKASRPYFEQSNFNSPKVEKSKTKINDMYVKHLRRQGWTDADLYADRFQGKKNPKPKTTQISSTAKPGSSASNSVRGNVARGGAAGARGNSGGGIGGRGGGRLFARGK